MIRLPKEASPARRIGPPAVPHLLAQMTQLSSESPNLHNQLDLQFGHLLGNLAESGHKEVCLASRFFRQGLFCLNLRDSSV